MTDLRKAAQQALDAWDSPMKDLKDLCVAMDALRTALEQQQAEPVAWMDREGDLYKMPEIKNWAPPHTMLYTTPPQPLAQPISFAGLTFTEVRVPFGMTVRFEGSALIVETVHNVKEGKTPAFISCDAHGNIISKERNHV